MITPYSNLRCRVQLIWEKKRRQPYSITEPSHAYTLVKEELEQADREVFLSILMTAKHHVIGIETVAIGAINSCGVYMRDLFKGALLANAFGIIASHNHPSGDPAPSQNDIDITQRIVTAGNILGVEVLDHIIVGRNGFTSLRELNHLKAQGTSILSVVRKATAK